MERLEGFVGGWLWADISCGRGRASSTNNRQRFGYSFSRRVGRPKDIEAAVSVLKRLGNQAGTNRWIYEQSMPGRRGVSV